MKRKAALLYSIVLIIGIVVLVNILASEFFVRFDLTENNQYTLSDATEQILDELNQPVTALSHGGSTRDARHDSQPLLGFFDQAFYCFGADTQCLRIIFA